MRRLGEPLLFVMSVVVLFLFWAALTSGFKAQESIVGVGAAVLSALLFLLMRKESGRIFQPRWRDLLQAWRIPGELLADSWTVIVVLALDLVGKRRAGSYYRAVPFDPGDDSDPEAMSRRSLVTAYMTVSPNAIVVGVDARQKLLLFHQLEQSPLPNIAKALGAQGE